MLPARPVRKRFARVVLLFAVVSAGCPKRFDPRAETLPSSSDPQASEEYRAAKARLDAGQSREAEQGFQSFVERHPTDPLARSARINEARAAIALRQPAEARALCEPLCSGPRPDDALEAATWDKCSYILGVALHDLGQWRRSRERLEPFTHSICTGDCASELHAVLGDDGAQLGDWGLALREWSLFFDHGSPAERLYLVDRVSETAQKLDAGEAARLLAETQPCTLAQAYLGQRVSGDRRAAGDVAGAQAMLDQTRCAREHAGIQEAHGRIKAAPEQAGGARAIGCLVPLSGKQRPLGERALRGELLAAALFGQDDGGGAPVEIKVRDTASDPARAAKAVEELADEGVAAIVGSPERAESSAAAPRAESLGVPFLELAPDPSRRGATVFKLVRSLESRAQALAQRAARVRPGAAIAILAPDTNYGHAMARAFADEARAAGARVGLELHYPGGATTFIEPARKLLAARPDALFIPAPANDLQLILGQLASTGVTRMAGAPAAGKTAQLYVTADGASASFLQASAKYLQGAVLAPVYLPDPSDPQMAQFLDSYRAAYNEEPSLPDVLAYDAVRAVRLALGHAPDRAQLAAALSHLGESGLTGQLTFTASGDRGGRPLLYMVQGSAIEPLK